MTSCSVCGHEFPAHRSDARYCSPACQKAGQRRHEHVHFARPSNDTPASADTALSAPSPTSEASTRRLSRVAIPDVEPCRAPVYAAGSLHGPIYDAKGNEIRGPVPEIVGYVGMDGRLEKVGHR